MRIALRPSYRRRGVRWEGVLREGRLVVRSCGHFHRNRDTAGSGPAAMDCSWRMLGERIGPEAASRMRWPWTNGGAA